MTSQRPDDALAREANVIARYLLDVDCPPRLATRYAQAVARRLPASSRDAIAVAGFALNHPWALPYMASAAPFFAAGSLLRWKLMVMSAILETSPQFAPEFLPRDLPLPRLLSTVATQSLLAATRAVIGTPLLFVARFSR